MGERAREGDKGRETEGEKEIEGAGVRDTRLVVRRATCSLTAEGERAGEEETRER